MLKRIATLPVRILKKLVGAVRGGGREQPPPPPAARPPAPPRPRPVAPSRPAAQEHSHSHDHGHDHGHDHDHGHEEPPKAEPPKAEPPKAEPPKAAAKKAEPPKAAAKKPAAKKPAAKKPAEAPKEAPKPAPRSGKAVNISVEQTPNPNAMKFTTDTKVADKPMSFMSGDDDHPMAGALFAVTGVRSVFAVNDFVTVTKQDKALWADLQGPIIEALKGVL